MLFTKMHGAGNDYVYVDGFRSPPPGDESRLAIALSDRHTGVGADGLIVVEPSDVADARMRMWNADGSEGGMCGNGLRCVAKLLLDRKHVAGPDMRIETGRGVLAACVEDSSGREATVRVEMGRPILEAAAVPTNLTGDPPTDAALSVDDREFRVTCVSMGNPHCVIFAADLNDELVRKFGPRIERHAAFPERTNVEFVRMVNDNAIAMRVWERGSGETRACGTGACAAVVAGVLTGRTSRRVLCRLPGGELAVEWDDADGVFLTGPAVDVFTGEWPGKQQGR